MLYNTRWQRVSKSKFTKVLDYLMSLGSISWEDRPYGSHPYVYTFNGFAVARVNPIDLTYDVIVAC